MAEGEWHSETVARLKKERRELLVGMMLAGIVTQQNEPAPRLIRHAFGWADAIIAESDLRQKDGE